MAGTKSTSQCSLLKPVSVPQCMQDGEKFIKWDEDSGSGTPVTLRVDAEGFYLYWVDQNKEMDMLDITTIRDARTGKYARIPKDSKLKQIVTMGSQDTLEEKTVTICYGSDFVNLTYINFCCTKKDIAQLWTDEILKIVYNMLQLNSSTLRFLRKVHTRLTLMTDKTGKIPIKNVIKIFTQNKEDRKRVEKALDTSGFPSGKNDAVSLEKFQFEDFFNFYKNLTQRTEVEKVFEELCGTQKRRFMTAAQLVEFLNKTQRDPRLNEILYPYANTSRAKDLIQQYEPNKYNAQRGQLSFDGFLQYLMSEDNPIISSSKLDLSDDMDQPLPHYFINSSHNTYLTGHQLTGKSAVEMYRQCLLAGCRCVELDFWNGRTEEPVIVHGYTFVPEIPAKEVIEAIAESAFKTSDYPVILSFENHCNPRQQAKIAQYCREIFGENLLDAPLESHKLEPGSELPPPSLLKRKIIIKNKKKHHHHHHKKNHNSSHTVDGSSAAAATQGNGDVSHAHPPPLQSRQGSKDSTQDDDDDDDESSSADEIEDDVGEEAKGDKIPAEKAAAQETEAGAEISALVNYVQPVHFSSFENSEKKNRPYEMSSFDEKQATTLLKESPVEFVNYNKHQLSRVYPSGTRFDSSNFMPQVFWNAGCQLVALNYQTLDLAMQLNLGIFEYNHRCGYLLKPEFMRRQDRRLDPFAESTVDGIIAGTVSVHVISAQFLTDRRVGVYVEVDMFGLPADTVRKKFRTKIVSNNGINPIFDEEAFVFKKVVLPELASLRISAYEESGKPIGHRVLPVVGLCPGYRHIALRNESGQPLPLATLFVHVVVKDYVPDTMSDFAEALANPIKYQSELEKREQQLAILTDDTDIVEDQEETAPTARQQRSPSTCVPAMAVKMVSAELTLMGPDRSPRPSLGHAFVSTDSSGSFSGIPVDGAADGAPADGTLPQKTQEKTENTTKAGPPPVNNCPSDSADEELVAESLEKLMENKVVKEKKLELEKKLESLRKKHEKERARIQMHKSSQDSEKSKSKFSMSHKLVKRLSSKNITDMQHQHHQHQHESELSESEGETTRHGSSTGLLRSHSERLFAMFRDHITQERELHEKYHELVFSAVEKLMAASQASQMKLLRALLDRETAEVMRRLQSARRDEVKALAKVHRDRDEMVRVKREVDAATVDRGVAERMRLTQLYERRRVRLETAHEQVRQKFQAEKEKAQTALRKEYEGRFAKIEEELKAAKTNFDVAQ